MKIKLNSDLPGHRDTRNAGGRTAAQVREMFGRVAPRYDLLNHALSLGLDWTWRRRAARVALGLGAGDIVLDVCAGTGDLAFALSRVAPAARVVGLDFSARMLALAVQKAAGAKGRVSFAEADAQHLPLRENTVALASVAFGVRNVPDPAAAVRELIRVTRPGGKIVILEFTTPRGALFGRLYLFYLRHVLPRIASLAARGAADAYHYLNRSVRAFAGPEEMRALLRSAGLTEVQALPLSWGVAYLYLGVKRQT